MDDSGIVSMLEARDEEAISELQIKYSAYLKKIAMNVVGNEPDAEECVNDTFYKAWQKIPPAKPPNLGAFLGKITRELAIDAYRAKKSRQKTASEYDEVVKELGFFDPSNDGTEQAVDQIILRDAIVSFLKSVSEKEKNVFIRRYFFFDPVKKIAQMYLISESTAKVILFRTRNKLKKYLEKEGYVI